MRKNLFIAFEGIDGSGKSTQAQLLEEQLRKSGEQVYSTFEPTDSFIGSLIRDILKGNRKADDRTIAGLFVADRLDHILDPERGLLKKLEQGFTVISDRYYFSSYAYHGTHMDIHWVIDANRLAADLLKPDLTIFVDISPAISMQRIHERKDPRELYETEENLQKVRDKYMEAFELLKEKEHYYVTDGNRPESVIAEDIWLYIRQMHVSGY